MQSTCTAVVGDNRNQAFRSQHFRNVIYARKDGYIVTKRPSCMTVLLFFRVHVSFGLGLQVALSAGAGGCLKRNQPSVAATK